jgi:hypothetical protein
MAKVSSFIPNKGVNKAVAELRKTNVFKQSKAMNGKAVREGLESVQREMADNAAKALPIQDVINRNTGVDVPRKANGRKDIKSAKESAHVFNQSLSNKTKDVKLDISDINKNKDKIGNAIGHMRDNKLANEIADSYGRGNGNKANRRIEAMRSEVVHKGKVNSLQKQIDAAIDADDMDKALKLQDKLNSLGEYNAPEKKKTFHERKAQRMERNGVVDPELEKMVNSFGDIEHTRPTNKKTANPQPETSPGNNSIMQQVQDKVKGNNFVYNMAAMGVGGGLVLNMANNKGQQSNAQLYGQY